MSAAKPRWTAGEPTALIRDFASNLRECREEVGLSPEDLSEAAEIGIEHLIELEEAGGTIPSVGVVLRLAGALGRRPSVLVAGVEWVPFEISAGQGRFEVVEDAGLVAEIAALKEELSGRGRTGRGGTQREP
jgi:transcriptional regulator with XRE-family HTH domain